MKVGRIAGCSAFGLADTAASQLESLYSEDFYLADALLPENPFGHIRVGGDAKADRTHSGMHWPPEARIEPGKPVRRVPIPYAWRALVESEDQNVRWKAGSGVTVPVPRILAAHLAGVLGQEGLGENNKAVVVIPNHLDEYGQDALLRELGRAGHRNALLIWRPVAAALAWLEMLGHQEDPDSIQPDDHIHVLYFGPDAIEFTTLRLRVHQTPDGLKHVLPLRDRPKGVLPRCTMDWAGRLIEEKMPLPDEGAFMQAFTSFPDVWEALTGKQPDATAQPRPWSFSEKWSQWKPSSDLRSSSLRLKAGPCQTLRSIYQASCPLKNDPEENEKSWEMAIRTEFRRLFRAYPKGRLRGLIICGPLAPIEVPAWLYDVLDEAGCQEFDRTHDLKEPKIDGLWLCPGETALARGAAIYGEKVSDKQPTYLDTMPQISILAQAQRQYKWVPLLKDSEVKDSGVTGGEEYRVKEPVVMGGEEFKDRIIKKFQLGKGSRQLVVHLRKEALELPDCHVDGDGGDLEPAAFGLPDCQARLLREKVRVVGSLERILGTPYFVSHDSPETRYVKNFAEFLFTSKDKQGDPDSDEDQNFIQSSEWPFRKAFFYFPSSPDRNMPLDISVRMKPASGLAHIEILPEDASFLKERKVFLDYSTMRPTNSLPRLKRCWPKIQEFVVDPYDITLHSPRTNRLINRFENTRPKAENYLSLVDRIANLLKNNNIDNSFGINVFTKVIDQTGSPCTEQGEELIRRIASKFQSDFREIRDDDLLNTLFVRASRLWGKTPDIIVERISTVLEHMENRQVWLWALDAASRSFIREDQFTLFYKKIADYYRLKIGGIAFPINSARSLCQLLMYRRDASLALDREKARLFAHGAFERLEEQHQQGKYEKIFFQCVMLLLFLLRVRRGDPSAFEPTSPSDLAPFRYAQGRMAEAIKYAQNKGDHQRAQRIEKVMIGLDKYIECEGDEGTIRLLIDLTEETDSSLAQD
ncbi:MAG: hypothetical protein KKB20_16855 [Proteobacteria bacterium]|nr:hypothetical protein [Pseudomonadota bacterium]